MIKKHLVLMQFCTYSMSTMLAITKHGVCVGIIAPCLVNFIMVDMEEVQNCITAQTFTLHITNKMGQNYRTNVFWQVWYLGISSIEMISSNPQLIECLALGVSINLFITIRALTTPQDKTITQACVIVLYLLLLTGLGILFTT